MSTEAISKIIEETLVNAWSQTPIAFENVPARDHSISGSPLLSEGDKNYIEVSVDVTDTKPLEIPLGLLRYRGYVRISVHVKEGTGTRIACGYIDDLNNIFQFKLLNDGTTCLRTHEFLDSGKFTILEGWVTYACQWPFSTEFQNS